MPDKQPTLYEILGVSPTATLEELKNAYREKTWQYHPDVNQSADKMGCHLMMCMINEAYAILRNIDSRIEYDKTLRESGKYPLEPHMLLEGEVSTPTDSQKNNQRRHYSSHSFSYETYQYYNEQDYDYYNQRQFVDYVKELYDYYFVCINTDDCEMSKKEMNIIEKLKAFLENIIDFEKLNSKKRAKSNRL